MDAILARMKAVNRTYGDGDLVALGELERRIIEAARTDCPRPYSELVKGIRFRLANVSGGAPFELDLGLDLHRAILGEFLGHISMRSYERGAFMLSALAIDKLENRPSRHFFNWMREIGALIGSSDDAENTFWVGQLRKAHAHYTDSPG